MYAFNRFNKPMALSQWIRRKRHKLIITVGQTYFIPSTEYPMDKRTHDEALMQQLLQHTTGRISPTFVQVVQSTIIRWLAHGTLSPLLFFRLGPSPGTRAFLPTGKGTKGQGSTTGIEHPFL
uniref:AlNc14C553G12137 protein n=1 Tax=Albugo laibachii Nc14 TaxID=890382 RepID=F0X145_9STRA|nr:AlNc14C553G12137 [Albugo laibachii Nc14]|eukprot:CCA27499.1 AlNc14C553G12137 [Albugo laibachii Nc14]